MLHMQAARGTLLLVCVKSERRTAYAGRARDIGKKAIQSPASVSKKTRKPRMKNRALFCEDTAFYLQKRHPAASWLGGFGENVAAKLCPQQYPKTCVTIQCFPKDCGRDIAR